MASIHFLATQKFRFPQPEANQTLNTNQQQFHPRPSGDHGREQNVPARASSPDQCRDTCRHANPPPCEYLREEEKISDVSDKAPVRTCGLGRLQAVGTSKRVTCPSSWLGENPPGTQTFFTLHDTSEKGSPQLQRGPSLVSRSGCTSLYLSSAAEDDLLDQRQQGLHDHHHPGREQTRDVPVHMVRECFPHPHDNMDRSAHLFETGAADAIGS